MMKLLLPILTILLVFSTPVYGSSLSDVVKQNQQQVQESTVQSSQTQSSTGVPIQIDKSQPDAISDLAGATDFSKSNNTVKEIQKTASEPITIAMQLLAWAITISVGFFTLVDIFFIVAPPFRGLLSGGAGATSATAGTATSGMPMNRGPDMGYGAYNGYGNGYNPSSSSTPVQPAGSSGFCLVSQEAINATTAVDPQTGRTRGALGVYASTATVKIVAAPILLVLTLTGVLQRVGFMIGSVIFNFLSNLL